MSNWVNWGDFSAANAQSSAQQSADAAAERQRQQDEVDRLMGALRQEQATAQSRESMGGSKFRGTDSLMSYGDAMKAAEQGMAQMQSQTAMSLRAAPWETDMAHGANQSEQGDSPWARFYERLSGVKAEGNSWRQSVEQQHAAAEKQRQAAQERAAQDASMKQKFYGGVYGKTQSTEMSQEDKRRNAQMLWNADANGEWRGNLNDWNRGALWESAYGNGSIVKTGFGTEDEDKGMRAHRGPFAPRFERNETWTSRDSDPARPKNWRGFDWRGE